MVAVLDKHGKPLMPCTERRARILLQKGRAVIHQYKPEFTIRLTDRLAKDSIVHPLAIGVDPGAKHTGIAITDQTTGKVISLYQIDHQREFIRDKLKKRNNRRRRRRSANLRYRKARFENRVSKHKETIHQPSTRHVVYSIVNFIKKLMKIYNIKKCYIELVKFDTQKLDNPYISGIEYQRGELYNVKDLRAYILAKYNNRCVYCGKPVHECGGGEIDHVTPRSRGGSNRVSNLVLACKKCNKAKGNKTLNEFAPHKAKEIRKQLKKSLAWAGIMNVVIGRLLEEIKNLGLKLYTVPGYETHKRRTDRNIPKTHAIDALFTTGSIFIVKNWNKLKTIIVKCIGRGDRRMARTNSAGFPIGHRERKKKYFNFITGDFVKAIVTKGKKIGTYIGRITVRKNGSFVINTNKGKIDGISYKYCKLLQYSNGYNCKLVNTFKRDVCSSSS